MKDFLQHYMQDTSIQNGLLLAQAPTGYGKSYQTICAIYDYVHSSAYQGQVLFVTPLIKNLPIEDLRRQYEQHGDLAAFSQDVLVLPSNLDSVSDAMDKVTVPEAFQTDTFQALENGLQQWKRLKQKPDPCLHQLAAELEDRLRSKLEPAFRQEIRYRLHKAFPGSREACFHAIESDPHYQWIGEFYPAVFTRRAKVLFLTVKKLMAKNDTLIEPSYAFLDERILQNSILCLDEFDATKKDILDVLIDRAQHLSSDYLDLFLRIHGRFHSHRFCSDLIQALPTSAAGISPFDALQAEGESLFQDFSLFYSIKTAETVPDNSRNFLFHDSSYQTVLSENKTHIRTVRDDTRQQVVIHFDTKEEYALHQQEPHISIHAMLRSIYTFLCKFQRFVQMWSWKYARQVNKKRASMQDLYTTQQAMETIYREFGLTENQIHLMTEDIDNAHYPAQRMQVLTRDLSVYTTGFRLFEFLDDDWHQSQTQLRYLQMSNTPEKVLLYLCRQAKVIGLSATAALPTVTGNYDLAYLKQQLGPQYQELPSAVQQRIQRELTALWTPYRDGSLQVQTEVVDRGCSGMEPKDRLRQLLPPKLVRPFTNRLALLNVNTYLQHRYCNILSAFDTFWRRKEIRSFLCLNEALPKPENPAFDLAFLQDCFTKMGKALAPDCPGDMVVLRSGEAFASEKENILTRLGNGEKLFLFSSYSTLGAGQNLQYPVPEGLFLITLPAQSNDADPRFAKKDMDALYLGDITNLMENLFDPNTFSLQQLFSFCTKMESLYQNDEISVSVLHQQLKAGIRHLASSAPDFSQKSSLKRTDSLRRQATRDILQAVGRICRTFQKTQIIHLLTTESVIRTLDTTCLQGSVLCPEMEALVHLCPPARPQPETDRTRNMAERIASQGNRYILRMLSNQWTLDSMQLWKSLRNTVLQFPCASRSQWENDPVIQSYYIPAPEKRPYYSYAQKGDFADIFIAPAGDAAYLKAQCPDAVVMEVSEAEARLQEILRYPGMKEYFTRQGWATTFSCCDYIMSPALFHNIYKGALGEAAGKFILEDALGLSLTEIEDPACFELFDYQLSDTVYVDFKHWKRSMYMDDGEMREKCRQKLEQLHGKRVYIINLLQPEGTASSRTVDESIVEISGLLQANGTLNPDALELLRREL